MEDKVKVVFDLSKHFTDIITLSFYVILGAFGIKSIIKQITGKVKVNKYISLCIVFVLSIVGCIFLPINIWWAKLIMSLFITGIAVGMYEPVMKHVMEAIPTIVQGFASRVNNNSIIVKKRTSKKK